MEPNDKTKPKNNSYRRKRRRQKTQKIYLAKSERKTFPTYRKI